jgi:hypothetical protein
MSEQTGRTAADDVYGRELQMRQQRQQWERRRAEQREQEKRSAKQAELQRYLSERAREWEASAGTPPPSGVLVDWQKEFVDLQALQHDAERAERLARAEESYDF